MKWNETLSLKHVVNYLPCAKLKIHDKGNFTMCGNKYKFWRNKVSPPPRLPGEDMWECELHPSIKTFLYSPLLSS